MSEAEQLEMWDKPQGDLSVADMDAAVVKLRELDTAKKEAKKVSDEASAAFTTQQKIVGDLLTAAGKTEYIVTGYGKVTLKEMLSVRTPKSPEEKRDFFNWVRENMGEDSYYHYMSVNSQSLNALYKEKVEEYGAEGKVLEINGIEAPTSYTKMSFTKA